MLCYQSGGDEQRQYRLGLKSSGFRAVENFVQARFELFVQVYYHKTNRAVEAMLGQISEQAASAACKIVSEDNLGALIEDYVNLGDDHFLDILRGRGNAPRVDSQEINSLAEKIHNRQLWKRVVDFQETRKVDDSRQSDNLKKEEEALKRQAEVFERLEECCGEYQLHLDKIKPKATKDLNTGAVILRQDVDGVYFADRSTTWEAISPIIKTLGEEERSIHRIYVKSSDSAVVKSVRTKARVILAGREGGASNAEPS
jgi:hypothetical protein